MLSVLHHWGWRLLWVFHVRVFWVFLSFTYVFLAVLGLWCCTWAFSSCGQQGLLSGCGVWASPCGEQALGAVGDRSCSMWIGGCGARAQLFPGMWDLPGPGMGPVSLALASRFSTTGPPGKPSREVFIMWMEVVSFCASFVECILIMQWCFNFVRCLFCINWDDHVFFFFPSFCWKLWYVHWILYVEPFLHSRNKFYLAVVCSPFNMLLNSFCQACIKDFCIGVYKGD